MLKYVDLYGTPYFEDRQGYQIRYIILHDTEGVMPNVEAWRDFWSTNERCVSVHDMIDQDGTVYHIVPYDQSAHHTGYGHIPGFNALVGDHYEPNLNLASIGIELVYPEYPASPAYPPVQLAAAVELVRILVERYNIGRDGVLRHKDVDPGRKSDPRNFPWEWFLDQVFGVVADEDVRMAAWKVLGISNYAGAAFIQYARAHALGAPQTGEFDFTKGGKVYRGQGFARAILYTEVGYWDRIYEVAW
jgi:N-acetyl-anhydromuramyl-L-alanine amidase AmpD